MRRSPWHGWYCTAEWRRLKAAVHQRDLYTCQMCGRICGGKAPAADSPVADHKTAHRGDRRLFFDPANVWTICKSPCHDQTKQAEEQSSLGSRGRWG